MNRVLCFLNSGCTCNHSRHLRWLERMKQIVEQIETAANLEEGFEFFTPNLSQLVEGDKERKRLVEQHGVGEAQMRDRVEVAGDRSHAGETTYDVAAEVPGPEHAPPFTDEPWGEQQQH